MHCCVVSPQHKTTKRHKASKLLLTFLTNFFFFVNETMLRPMLGHCFLLELPKTYFISHWLLWVIYLGTVREPGRAVHSGHA